MSEAQLFALRKEDGAYYPVILLDGQSFHDDACGGYELKADAVKAVHDSYGQEMKCVSQSE